MKQVPSQKDKRKEAELSILRNMRLIKKQLDAHKVEVEEPVDKEKVMSVLTRFLDLKRSTKIH